MTRKYIDCREMPSNTRCTVAIAAEQDDELIEAVVQHAIMVHHEHDTPELRKQIRTMAKVGSPSA
jgi:predicted small metal-binding protein